MSLSLYQSSVPVFERSLNAFSAILDKAAAHAAACKFDPAIYMTMRLRPDMFAFDRQTQVFCDHAKRSSARLAGVEPPRFEDNEASLDELKARIKKTLDVHRRPRRQGDRRRRRARNRLSRRAEQRRK